MTANVLVAMFAVAVGFVALAVTDPQPFRDAFPGYRKAAVLFWWAILIVGWACFAYLAFRPGGLDAAWAWVRAQPIVMQGAMWLLLLPWMVCLAIWQTGLSEGARTLAIIVIAIGWSSLARQLSGPRKPTAFDRT